MEEKKNLALGKINSIMLAISMVIVVIGFVMMSGASSDTTQYNPEIFSAMRIKVAPVFKFLFRVKLIFPEFRCLFLTDLAISVFKNGFDIVSKQANMKYHYITEDKGI